jgi:hypothetical protein
MESDIFILPSLLKLERQNEPIDLKNERQNERIGLIVKEMIGGGFYNPHALEILKVRSKKMKGVLVVYITREEKE